MGNQGQTQTTIIMANNNVILYKDFDARLINFDVVSKNKMGGKIVRLSYGPTKQPVRIQTPVLYLPFGVSKYVDEKTGETTQSLDCAFRDMDNDPKMQAFYDTIQKVDDILLQTCVERSTEWLGKPMSADVITEFFRPLIKPPRDPKYSPLFKIKVVPLPGTNALPKIFDMKDTTTPIDDLDYIVKGTSAKFIVTIPSVWFVNKTFGVSARLFQGVVTSRPVSTNAYAFAQEDPDDYAEDTKGHDEAAFQDDL
jgi:hypothetical protein